MLVKVPNWNLKQENSIKEGIGMKKEEFVKEITNIDENFPQWYTDIHIGDTCVCCGKKADKMVIWGRQY